MRQHPSLYEVSTISSRKGRSPFTLSDSTVPWQRRKLEGVWRKQLFNTSALCTMGWPHCMSLLVPPGGGRDSRELFPAVIP